MKIRFICDANFDFGIVNSLRRLDPRIDIKTADEAGLRGLADPKILEIAAADGRVLLTHDRRTMPRHFATFILSETCSGVIIIAQNVSERTAVEELYLIWACETAEKWVNRIGDVPY